MSNFTKTVLHETSFDGDDIKVEMKRLSTNGMLAITDMMGVTGKDEKVSLKPSDIIAFARDYLPEHVVSISGLTDAAKNPMELKDVMEESYFFELVSDIAVGLLEKSKVTPAEEGNSDAQPSTSTDVQASRAE